MKTPTDKQVAKWYSENIDEKCSASSGIYKFKLWLEETEEQPEVSDSDIEAEYVKWVEDSTTPITRKMAWMQCAYWMQKQLNK